MSDTTRLKEAIGSILDQIGREPLRDLLFTAIEPNDLDEYISRLSYYVAPSYLPFATDDSGTMIFHVLPDRDLGQSPILYVPNDAQEARFVCNRLATLPSALWLWVCTYLETTPEVLRQATETIAEGIPEARPVPERLWSLIEYHPSRWSTRPQANQAWEIADVGHPFAGIPELSVTMKPEEALSLLEPFVSSRSDVPELISVLLACRAKVGLPRQATDVLQVLSAEAWREISCRLDGWWRMRGEGMCEWDCTLRNLEDRQSVLRDTPFEVLIDHPDTYSGKDKEGPTNLLKVAKAFRTNGEPKSELCQRRNAATLSLLTFGEYPTNLAMTIAEVCDEISTDSLAAAVARESARVHEMGP